MGVRGLKLIDADGMKKFLKFESDYDFIHNDDDDFSAGKSVAWRTALKHIDEMPAVDAIPVEWLRGQREPDPKDEADFLHNLCLRYVLVLWDRAGSGDVGDSEADMQTVRNRTEGTGGEI